MPTNKDIFPSFSANFDETGIKINDLWSSFFKNILTPNVAVPFKQASSDYILWSFGIVEFILSYFEQRILLKLALWERGQCCMFHYCPQTDSVKLSLLFSFL